MTDKYSRRGFLAGSLAVTGGCLAAGGATRHAPPVTCVAFSPDAKIIVAGSQSGLTLHSQDVSKAPMAIPCEMDNVHALRFSPSGETLVAVGGTPGETGIAQEFSWPSCQPRRQSQLHDDVIYDVDVAADAKHWLFASADEVCSVVGTDWSRPLQRFTEHSRAVLAAKFLHDSQTVVTASRDQTLRVWDRGQRESLRTLHNHSDDVVALAVRPGNGGLPMIASASTDRTVRFWQPTIGRMVRFARLPSRPHALAWNRDGQSILAGGEDGKCRTINLQTVRTTDENDLGQGWIYDIAVSETSPGEVAFGTSEGLTLRPR